MTSDPEDNAISAASTRAAGVSALRKIRRLVDEENAIEHHKAVWSKRVIAIAAALLTLVLAYFLLKKF